MGQLRGKELKRYRKRVLSEVENPLEKGGIKKGTLETFRQPLGGRGDRVDTRENSPYQRK
jgi:hypothetical protein